MAEVRQDYVDNEPPPRIEAPSVRSMLLTVTAFDVTFACMTRQITAGQFHAADGVEDWRCLYHVVSAYFPTGSLDKGIELVAEIGRLADEHEQQYLTLDLRRRYRERL